MEALVCEHFSVRQAKATLLPFQNGSYFEIRPCQCGPQAAALKSSANVRWNAKEEEEGELLA